MLELLKASLTGQFEAALWMLRECLERCPAAAWETPIAKYPFWMVAYHTLCFADLYLSPGEAVWTPRPELHPKGWAELNDEYPSRRFERPELLGYTDLCRAELLRAMARETADTLAGPSGFSRIKFSRAELHLYNLRHVQHHTGQLSAVVRKAGGELAWKSRGWV
jgi:hypothetical protein